MAETKYTYRAKLIRVLDGDTIEVDLVRTISAVYDFGFHVTLEDTRTITKRQTLRILGINAPELKDRKADPDGPGEAAKLVVERLLAEAEYLVVVTHKPDKYGGRYLASVGVPQLDGSVLDLAQYLVEHGHAKVYIL